MKCEEMIMMIQNTMKELILNAYEMQRERTNYKNKIQ